jgi:type II secretory pathway component PulM
MKEWIKENQIMFSRGLGAFLLVTALAAFFWANNSNSAATIEEQRAAERVARMEARVSGNAAEAKALKATPIEIYSDRSKEQLKYLIILMMIIGALSLGYSFLKKE